MGITLAIVGGIVIITVLAIGGDYLTKAKVARSSIDPEVIKNFEKRINELEQRAQGQEKTIQILEGDIAFTNKLLEDKRK